MKDDWERRLLGDVCQVVNGGTPRTEIASYWGGSHAWITPAEMGRLPSPSVSSTARTLSDDGLANSSAKLIPPNSVILSTRAPIGHLVINEVPMAFNQGCRGLVPSALLITKYLYYFLLHSTPVLEGLGTGATFKELSAGKLKGMTIPVPPVAEQERIVHTLDEALERLSKARGTAETTLIDSGELWQSKLQEAFAQSTEGVQEMTSTDSSHLPVQAPPTRLRGSTRTGGRAATTRRIDGEYSLAVGPSSRMPRPGWQWTKLDSLARLESGHTPSRKHAEYWSGKIPWIGIEDARAAHGGSIEGTAQHVTEKGVVNSSTRLLPSGTVCLSRTASVGYVVIMATEMCTSQDFVNWVCSPSLDPEFLMYLFLAEGRKGLLRFASGSVHQTIYFPEVKAFHICHPDIAEQERIVSNLRSFRTEVERLQALQRNRVAALDELRASMLHQAFAGQL